MVQFNTPGMTAKQYDQIWADLRAAGQENPKGLLYHVGAQDGNNWVVVDTWESEEAFNEFGKTLIPLLSKNGVQENQPKVLPLHNEYTGK